MDAIEGALNSLKDDIAARMSSVSSMTKDDVRFVDAGAILELSEAPQVILTDFRLSRTMHAMGDVLKDDGNRDTFTKTHIPALYDVEFTIIAVAKEHWAAWRMVETLTEYFSERAYLAVQYGSGDEAFTVNLGKSITVGFVDRTTKNDGGLKTWEATARICDLPISDGYRATGKVIKTFNDEIIEGPGQDAEHPEDVNGVVMAEFATEAE